MSRQYFFHFHHSLTNALHRKSNWVAPKPKHHNLNKFFHNLKEDLSKFTFDHPFMKEHANLSRAEILCLKELSTDPAIVIKQADKGGSIVIMNKEEYLNKVNAHLQNSCQYKKVLNNPTKDLINEINSYIETIYIHQYIDINTAKFITPTSDSRLPIFYTLPKIHKEGVPGRPIVSAVSSATENISEFLNLCLQPILPHLQSYVKNTKHFITLIRNLPRQDENYFLVSADVTSLYTNIPHREGVAASIHYMRKFKHLLPSFTPHEGIVRTLFHFVLEKNYFEFGNEVFLQLIGTAMGTRVAPPYASLFPALFEETHILNNYSSKLKAFLRFLDDLFFIWKGSIDELHQFFDEINSVHSTILNLRTNIQNTRSTF